MHKRNFQNTTLKLSKLSSIFYLLNTSNVFDTFLNSAFLYGRYNFWPISDTITFFFVKISFDDGGKNPNGSFHSSLFSRNVVFQKIESPKKTGLQGFIFSKVHFPVILLKLGSFADIFVEKVRQDILRTRLSLQESAKDLPSIVKFLSHVNLELRGKFADWPLSNNCAKLNHLRSLLSELQWQGIYKTVFVDT